MAGEEIAPKNFENERRNLVRRIGRRAESMSAPDPELYAMLSLALGRRVKLSQKISSHLQRMIAAEFVLITNTADYPEFEITGRAVREKVAQKEIWAFEKAGDDLRDLTPTRKAALSDVLKLQERVELD